MILGHIQPHLKLGLSDKKKKIEISKLESYKVSFVIKPNVKFHFQRGIFS